MLRKTIIALAAITIFMSVTALAVPPKTGCQKFNFVGTFLSPSHTDVHGDGTVFHELAYQLTLHSDGTVNQYWTGLPDYLSTEGTGSPQIGSWTCRSDGKLVIVWLQASYAPVVPTQDPHVTSNDVRLSRHFRTTYLFSVDDDNTLTRLQSRSRSYLPSEDPTDVTKGTLGNLNTQIDPFIYKRLIASDADLVAP